jgi:hypothetical protein
MSQPKRIALPRILLLVLTLFTLLVIWPETASAGPWDDLKKKAQDMAAQAVKQALDDAEESDGDQETAKKTSPSKKSPSTAEPAEQTASSAAVPASTSSSVSNKESVATAPTSPAPEPATNSDTVHHLNITESLVNVNAFCRGPRGGNRSPSVCECAANYVVSRSRKTSPLNTRPPLPELSKYYTPGVQACQPSGTSAASPAAAPTSPAPEPATNSDTVQPVSYTGRVGEVYEMCETWAKRYAVTDEEVCKCVAREVAEDFREEPNLPKNTAFMRHYFTCGGHQ